MATVDELHLAFNYKVGTAPVTITIRIGDGQIGGSALQMDDVVIGTPGAVEKQVIGDGPKIAGKTLLARTLVADVNKTSNWTSVTYTLEGGDNHPPFTFSHQVPNDGDAARYNTTITFTN